MRQLSQGRLIPIQKETAPLRSRIIESMRRAIEQGILQPGERLVEKDLCEQLGVSRTSLREALRELEAEGIIAHASARGLTVVRISRRDAENIYRIRAEVEALIVGQFLDVATDKELDAVERLCADLIEAYKRGEFVDIVEAKRDFHTYLCRVADNAVALDLLSRLTLRTAQLRSRSVVRKERQEQSIREVTALKEAILRKDAAGAREAARLHVMSAADSALDFAEPEEA